MGRRWLRESEKYVGHSLWFCYARSACLGKCVWFLGCGKIKCVSLTTESGVNSKDLVSECSGYLSEKRRWITSGCDCGGRMCAKRGWITSSNNVLLCYRYLHGQQVVVADSLSCVISLRTRRDEVQYTENTKAFDEEMATVEFERCY